MRSASDRFVCETILMWTWSSMIMAYNDFLLDREDPWMSVSEKCDSLGFLIRCSSESFNLFWFLRSSFLAMLWNAQENMSSGKLHEIKGTSHSHLWKWKAVL